ncbi:MAG: hypothetical protein GY798_32810 [Hyphomicrobiales bacterium]|nr:hypothetical protein [Hyphomicrobiales bacterium]
MRALVITLFAVLALTACTTAQKTATGAGVGAAVGGLATGRVGGAVAGAAIAGFGTYLYQTRNGKCQYRNSKGKVYTTKCHWRR